jgi:hypothetical protein
MTLLKIKNFIKSLWFHVWLGFPKCTTEQIHQRFAICTEPCDMYNSNDSTCMMCGCNVNNRRIFLNKLAWADQECPIGKWKKHTK